jgi:hypothetical protein
MSASLSEGAMFPLWETSIPARLALAKIYKDAWHSGDVRGELGPG